MSINLPDKSVRKEDDGNILKRRLLGAAVLIALAVIFLPLLLDGSGSESRFRRVEQLRVEPPRILDSQGQLEAPKVVPPKPVVKAEPTPASPAPERPSEPATTSVQQTPAPKPAAPSEKAPTAPTKAVDASSGNDATSSAQVKNLVAWVVQAGSFADQANALSLRDELRAASFPAFVSADPASGIYRVKVGPITDQQQAAKVKAQVESLFNLDTLIRQYR